MPLKLGEAAAGGIASAASGGKGGKGGPTSKQSVTGSNSTTGTSSLLGTNATNFTEAPGILNFQESLLPAVASLYNKAQQPVYGAAQEAQILNSADQATKAGQDAVTNALARSGGLNSGLQAAADTSLQAGNLGSLTNFLTQVPFLNQQAELQNTGNVLGLAENIVGRAPINSTTTTNQSSQNSTTGTNSNTTLGWGNSFGNQALGNLGGLLGGVGLNGYGNAKTNSGPSWGATLPELSNGSGDLSNFGSGLDISSILGGM